MLKRKPFSLAALGLAGALLLSACGNAESDEAGSSGEK